MSETGRAGERWWRQQAVASLCWLPVPSTGTQQPGRVAGGARPGSLPGRLRLAGTEPGGRWREGAAGHVGGGLALVVLLEMRCAGPCALPGPSGTKQRFCDGITGASYRLRLGAGGGRELGADGSLVVLAASVVGCRLRGISAARWAATNERLLAGGAEVSGNRPCHRLGHSANAPVSVLGQLSGCSGLASESPSSQSPPP